MFDLGCDFAFHRILKSSYLSLQKVPDEHLLGQLMLSAHHCILTPTPAPDKSQKLANSLAGCIARLHEEGTENHPSLLPLADLLTQRVDEPSIVATLYLAQPDKLPERRAAFAYESLGRIARELVDNNTTIMPKP